jgi:hypothetical protein
MQKVHLVRWLGVTFVLVIATQAPAAAADNWIGTWKLDAAKSQYSPGPGPKSQTITYTAAPDGWALTSEMVNAQGQTMKSGYIGKADGKDHPWTGNPDADMVVLKRIDANSFETQWKRGGVVVMTSHAVVSNGGKSLTIHQTGKNAAGQDVKNTLVLERQ